MSEARPTLIRYRRPLPRPPKLVIAIVLVLIMPVIVGGLHIYLNCSQPFDRQRWMAAGVDGSARAPMMDDLLAHYLQPGTSRSRVYALLGKSGDSEGTPVISYGASLRDCTYRVMRIQFDRSDTIERTFVEDVQA